MTKLSDGRGGNIAKAEAPAKGVRFIFDSHRDAPRGFALRITAAGGKAFVLRYRIDGRERLMTIGAWPTWSVEAARDEARKLAVRIDRGDDPLEEKRRRRDEPTVADLAAEWLDKHATGLKSEHDIRGLVRHDLIPALGRLKVTDLRRRDVIEMVEAKAETAPRSAAQLLVYTRKLLTYAADREIIPVNPVADLKPASISVKGRRDPLRPRHRERILDADEIRAFWTRAEDCGLHRLTALALKLVLVTGQRPGEVAGMHEGEIDGRLWTIPAARRGKTETAHAVHLTDLALAIVEAAAAERDRLAKRRRAPWAGYVFEARPGSPITAHALSRAVARYADALGSKNLPSKGGQWRPHDLRRTMRTGLSACRVRPDIAELCTGHVIPGIRAVYDRHDYGAEQRAAHEAWAARLSRIVAGEDPDADEGGNVVKLGARA